MEKRSWKLFSFCLILSFILDAGFLMIFIFAFNGNAKESFKISVIIILILWGGGYSVWGMLKEWILYFMGTKEIEAAWLFNRLKAGNYPQIKNCRNVATYLMQIYENKTNDEGMRRRALILYGELQAMNCGDYWSPVTCKQRAYDIALRRYNDEVNSYKQNSWMGLEETQS